MTWENNCMVTMQTSDWWDEVGKEGRLPAWSGGWQPPPSRSSSWLVQPHWLGHCALTRWHTTTLPHSAGLSHFHSGSHYQTITKPHLPRPHIRMEGGNLASEHLEQYHPAQKIDPAKNFEFIIMWGKFIDFYKVLIWTLSGVVGNLLFVVPILKVGKAKKRTSASKLSILQCQLISC